MTEGKGVVKKMGGEGTSAFYNEMLSFHMEGWVLCQYVYSCVVVFVFSDTALSMQQYSDELPTEKEFRKVQGNPKWIYLLAHSLIFVIRCLGPK